MTMRALSSPSADLPVGAVWALVVSVRDLDGMPAEDAPTFTVVAPADGTTSPAAEEIAVGIYRAEVTVDEAGRWTAQVTGEHGAAQFTAYASEISTAASFPDVDDVRAYLDGDSYSDEQIQGALDAEAAAQRKACRIPADYPADLREALLRRTQRNLAMRPQPLAIVPGGDDSPATVIPSRDPEVRRLEGPYRKLVMG